MKKEDTEEDEDTAPEDLAPLLGWVVGALDAVQHPGHGAPSPHVLTVRRHEAAHVSSHRVLEKIFHNFAFTGCLYKLLPINLV